MRTVNKREFYHSVSCLDVSENNYETEVIQNKRRIFDLKQNSNEKIVTPEPKG
jgi:alpha-D-ribose 1-methylphosphonate 5-phosphate C-P lyase